MVDERGPSIGAFAKAQLVKVTRRQELKAPLDRDSLIVTAVAPDGPAGQAMIRPGMRLVAVDGRPAVGWLNLAKRVDQSSLHYQFYDPITNILHDVHSTGLRLGIRLIPTAAAIEAEFVPGTLSDRELFQLWELGNWDIMARLCAADVEAVLAPRWRHRFYQRPLAWLTPKTSYVMWGVARHQQGHIESGQQMIRAWLELVGWPKSPQYQAILWTIYAIALMADEQREKALSMLYQAYETYPFQRIAAVIARQGATRPFERNAQVGELFPLDFTLPVIHGGQGSLHFGDALQTMRSGQLLLICLMDEEEADEQHHELIGRFVGYMKRDFSGYLAGLYLVTLSKGSPDKVPFYRKLPGELVERYQLGLSLLWDCDGTLTHQLMPPTTPFIYAVRSDGVIVHVGLQDDVDLWNALTRQDIFTLPLATEESPTREDIDS